MGKSNETGMKYSRKAHSIGSMQPQLRLEDINTRGKEKYSEQPREILLMAESSAATVPLHMHEDSAQNSSTSHGISPKSVSKTPLSTHLPLQGNSTQVNYSNLNGT